MTRNVTHTFLQVLICKNTTKISRICQETHRNLFGILSWTFECNRGVKIKKQRAKSKKTARKQKLRRKGPKPKLIGSRIQQEASGTVGLIQTDQT
jgi:hypothetical protein